jgi:hypothetical protein
MRMPISLPGGGHIQKRKTRQTGASSTGWLDTPFKQCLFGGLPRMGYNEAIMYSDASKHLHRLPTLRAVCGIGLVLLYLAATTPLTPALTTLVAMADRSHQVAVELTRGGIQVVLRHDGVHDPAHRHGILAWALTRISQGATPGRPDHVIQFAASPISDQAPALVRGPASDVPVPGLLQPANLPPRMAWPLAVSPGTLSPPPDSRDTLVNVRSTVLLI